MSSAGGGEKREEVAALLLLEVGRVSLSLPPGEENRPTRTEGGKPGGEGETRREGGDVAMSEQMEAADDSDDGEPRLSIVDEEEAASSSTSSASFVPGRVFRKSVSFDPSSVSADEKKSASEAIESLLLLGQGPVMLEQKGGSAAREMMVEVSGW